jgi:signal peptidase II
MTVRKLSWIILAILVADQALKVYIKLNYSLTYYGNGPIVDWGWFRLLFVENRGMAWGASLSDFLPFISEDTAKLLLSIFRLVAVSAIGVWLLHAVKLKVPKLQLIAVSLIFAGALGNIIDSVFYGVLFSETTYNQLATFMPEEGGYAPLMFGHVVDMFQFPMFTWTWPNWLPLVGGNQFTFFEPVFNIADSAISIGVVLFLLQQRQATT